MNFWRKEVIEPALAHETARQMDEQRAWIAKEPGNARPYFQLAQFYRLEGRVQEALGLLLEAVRLEPAFGEAHVSLAQLYAVSGDYPAARRHAHAARQAGDSRAVDLLSSYGAL